MKRLAAILTALIVAAATYALPPGFSANTPAARNFRDISIPIAQVSTFGNVSIHGGMVDVTQITKKQDGKLATETIVTGARSIGLSPDRRSVVLRIPESQISALSKVPTGGAIILTPHR
jgi:hypothetical protein